MAEFSLYATPALGGYSTTHDGIALEELDGLGLISIATPLDSDAALAAALKKGFGAEIPAVGKVASSSDSKIRFLGMAPGQLFAAFEHDGPNAEGAIADKLAGAGYTTDQSDVWVGLRIAGPEVRTVLERICPLDLAPNAFAQDKVARTAMEHMAAIVFREGEDGFVLLTARSSAKSFLHALEVSIANAL
ncbi:sarcosine oxidase subunit gamma family protein [Methyloligella sp. 2.7D]|uniref:sarcosine oxidase subunit gamma n=1 Tax=unclassified Methyloligella TaxID=2625955 RepID=UPI00157D7CD9|nr:sarcosine oxidase subunit gamma family protein [Methyloligella sp. GL2]QKP78142.1 sarcosine oxidase subunit gamma [Methyloligella sp. GL2]